MNIDADVAMKIWNDFFGSEEWAVDCYGTWMNKHAYSDNEVNLIRPGTNQRYDYSWNIDHICPKSQFKSESEANIYNNLEPIHRQNNLAKADKTVFDIDGHKYWVVADENGHGYGIKNELHIRIDGKAKGKWSYQ